MKIIKPSVEFFGEVPTDPAEAIKFIERVARVCYKSEDKITDTSAEPFVKRLIKAGHLAMVEHSNFVVRCEINATSEVARTLIQAGKYLNVAGSDERTIYVGGSLTAWFNRFVEVINTPGEERYLAMFDPFRRAFAELFFPELPFLLMGKQYDHWQVCPHDEIPKELHRYSAKFICDRGVSHELVRHRPCSFAQESTRYVNYGGKDMEFIEPAGFESWPRHIRYYFEQSCEDSETEYKWLLNNGLKPQQARAVLPNALKTEIVVTADAAEWRHIFNLRTAKDAHPDMRRVMAPLHEEFKTKYPEAFK